MPIPNIYNKAGKPADQKDWYSLLLTDIYSGYNRYPAESTLRPYVIWRKLSFATQSLRGLRFRTMILTLTASARQLGMSSWEMLPEITSQGFERKAITFQFPFDQQFP